MTDTQAVCQYLAPRTALIALDNCEHLADACAELAATVLSAAPGVAVLATSRATLRVEGETDWRVPPLTGADAETLFVERARRARPDFTPSDAVTAICRRLDGLPLAIELAAAHVRTLSVEQLARAALRPVRAAGRWGPVRRSNASALCAPRWTGATVSWAPANSAYCDGSPCSWAASRSKPPSRSAMPRSTELEALVDQSLVLAAPHGTEMRYRLLETVREYGLERLAEAREDDVLRGRQRDWFSALALEAAPHLESPRQPVWFARLEPEAANLAAAMDHALGTDPSTALEMCAVLYPFWRTRGRFAEAALAQTRALAAGADAPPGMRARVLITRAIRLTGQGDPATSVEQAREALALAEEAGDRRAAARARCLIGNALQFARPSIAGAEFARAAELAQAAGDDWALLHAHLDPAFGVTFLNDHARARRMCAAIDDVIERVGEPYDLGRRLMFVGLWAVNDGRLDEAYAATDRCYAAVTGLQEPIITSGADGVVGLTDVWAGRHERALERLPGQLEHALRVGAGMAVPFLMSGLGFAALAAGRLEEARERLRALARLSEGRNAYTLAFALNWLAETERLLGDDAAEETATRARRVSGGSRQPAVGHARPARARPVGSRSRRLSDRAATRARTPRRDRRRRPPHLGAGLPGRARRDRGGPGRDEDAARLLATAAQARSDLGVARVVPGARALGGARGAAA